MAAKAPREPTAFDALDALEHPETPTLSLRDAGRDAFMEVKDNAKAALFTRVVNEVFLDSLGVVQGAMKAFDFEPDAKTYPEDWPDRFGGRKNAQRMFRIAKMALMPQNKAPQALSMARSVVVGAMKQQQTDKPIRTLNIGTAVLVLNEKQQEVFDALGEAVDE